MNRRVTRAAAAAAVAAAVLVAGCGSGHARTGASTGFLAGLSPLARRVQAQDAAWDKAHSALVHCGVTVWVLLGKSDLYMQGGGQGILPSQAAVQYGAGSAIANVYAQFYDALASYVTSHGVQGLQGGAVQVVAGKISRHGLPGLLEQACQADLHPVRLPGPVPPRQQAGFAAALAIWKQTPLVAAVSAGGYLLRAAADRRAADAAGYAAAIRELTDLASIPETGDTAAQMAQAQADVAALDRFFGTPGLTPNA